jgi:predicted nucleotidyltransferase
MIRLEQVRSQREPILRLAANYGIRRVRLFGSVARGAVGLESDWMSRWILNRAVVSWHQVGFKQDLEALRACRADVVAEGGISPCLETSIRQEALPL